MEELTYSIANHTLTLLGEGVKNAMSQLYGFDVFLCTPSQKEWTILFNKPKQTIDFKALTTFSFENVNCAFGKKSDTAYIFSMQNRNSDRPALQLEYTLGEDLMRCSGFGEPIMLRFALWTAFNLFAIPHNLFAIHSSTIVYNKKANLFLGESGTGKSTHTRLWLKNFPQARLLNDDSPIVAIENEQVMVYGSPWSGKTHCYHNVGFPVNSFVRLQQAPENSITKLNPVQAFMALQPACPPALSKDEYYSEKIVEILNQIIQKTSIFKLGCLPNDEAAILSRNTLYNN